MGCDARLAGLDRCDRDACKVCHAAKAQALHRAIRQPAQVTCIGAGSTFSTGRLAP